MKSVKQACDACGATGLYSGFCEPKGVAVVCVRCGGKGWYMHEYQEFSGRKRRAGVTKIMQSRGTFIATGVGPTGNTMTYDQFLGTVKE